MLTMEEHALRAREVESLESIAGHLGDLKIMLLTAITALKNRDQDRLGAPRLDLPNRSEDLGEGCVGCGESSPRLRRYLRWRTDLPLWDGPEPHN
jgi:hypothetical protein